MAEIDFFRTKSTPKFEDYKKQFADVLIMERKNGILQARMHTNGGPFKWSPSVHHMLLEAWSTIGLDTENEVLILTSTDPYWIREFDHESFAEWDAITDPDLRYHGLYRPTRSVENFIWGIDIPTIGAINGPGSVHWNFAVLCDITLCTPDFVFQDVHFKGGAVPGDSQGLLLQGMMGIKRAAYAMYLGSGIDAGTALDLGIVNEVLEKDKILPRAWEIAEEIMKQPRAVRRLTHQLTARPFKRLIMDDYQVHIASEMYGFALLKYKHDFEAVKKYEEEGRSKNL